MINADAAKLIKLEAILLIQSDLLTEQGKLIEELIRSRDEAIRNLQTASAQWKVWRQQETR
jgi:hypothetical protein